MIVSHPPAFLPPKGTLRQRDFFISTIMQTAHAKDEMSKPKDNAVISKDNGHLKRETNLKGETTVLEGSELVGKWNSWDGQIHRSFGGSVDQRACH